ncbi:unnamed protein product, partial [Meganyctiphanes norvegica]
MDLNPDSWPEDTDKDDYYNFSHEKRGDCIIFNQENFDDPKVKDRCGSDMDTNKCQELFEYLRFQVQVCKDLTVAEIKDKIEQAYIPNTLEISLFITISSHSYNLIEIRDGVIRDGDFLNQYKSHTCKTHSNNKIYYLPSSPGSNMVSESAEMDKIRCHDFSISSISNIIICVAYRPPQREPHDVGRFTGDVLRVWDYGIMTPTSWYYDHDVDIMGFWDYGTTTLKNLGLK